MKIDDSSIQLYSQHSSLEKNEKNESLTVWQTGQEPRKMIADRDGIQGLEALKKLVAQSVKVTLSDEARKVYSADKKTGNIAGSDNLMSDLNLRILQLMIERITGKKIQTADLKSLLANADAKDVDISAAVRNPVSQESGNQEQNSGVGLVYQNRKSHYESESTSFTAQGKIVTQDGKEINFSTQLTMSREFYSEENQTIKMGEALKDPLVINFSGTAAQITQTTFAFDLNADGKTEQTAFVSPGSGFLALDKNGDNKINDGSELFGPATGNGFSELSSYDSDGNNWIDENDPIFNQLRIWTKDATGQDNMVSLGQAGIGALYLGNIATPFSVKNSANDTVGQIQSTGIFVQENGLVGTIQQLDLVA